jgi:EAL domain-containing protein (putative c-di-GMP-specific phosphodiesterase class I)
LFLRSAGCERMQGYFFARPMPADAMEALLREANTPEPRLAVAS